VANDNVSSPHLHQTSLDGGSQLSLKEEMEVNMIRSLISSYFAIVRQSIQDLVPKAIMHLLVNHTSHTSKIGWFRRCISQSCSRSCCTRTSRL
jgi:replication fork clamp-binding protein CrfC